MRGGWDMLVLAFFVVCGISRLARFNVTAEALSSGTGKVKYFEGTPIPTSILIVIVLGVAFSRHAIDDYLWFGSFRVLELAILHPLTLIYAVSGMGMISATLRIPKP
jgi:CDP-diacylglycerol--serine O-phosphatidyltransferase